MIQESHEPAPLQPRHRSFLGGGGGQHSAQQYGASGGTGRGGIFCCGLVSGGARRVLLRACAARGDSELWTGVFRDAW
jgi:hypothetical protein